MRIHTDNSNQISSYLDGICCQPHTSDRHCCLLCRRLTSLPLLWHDMSNLIYSYFWAFHAMASQVNMPLRDGGVPYIKNHFGLVIVALRGRCY